VPIEEEEECLLSVSTLRIHLQEDGCTHRYGITCPEIAIKGTVISKRKHIIPYCNCRYNRLPEDEPSVSKHVEDNVKTKRKILV
jgi:hypothetical protein